MTSRRLPLAILGLCGVLAARPLLAQTAAPDTAACDYRRCAYGIAPAWDGLAVVRGANESRVANLYFLWPRDISAHFAGSDSAMTHVRRAVHLRRIGAVLTNAGALTLLAAAAGALNAGHARRSDSALGLAGAAAFAVSVPLQFAADGELSRAVWWHNLRLAR
jgi:hypothetical protein